MILFNNGFNLRIFRIVEFIERIRVTIGNFDVKMNFNFEIANDCWFDNVLKWLWQGVVCGFLL